MFSKRKTPDRDLDRFIEQSNTKGVQHSLENGADPNTGNFLTDNMLQKALICRARYNVNIIRYLIAAGAEIDTPHKTWGAPLHIATENNLNEAVRVLIQNQADINVISPFTLRPPLLHIHHHNPKIERMLIANGANLYALNPVRPFDVQKIAAHFISDKRFTLEYGVDPNTLDTEHNPVVPSHHELRPVIEELKHNQIDTRIINGATSEQMRQYARIALGQKYFDAAHHIISNHLIHTSAQTYADVHLHAIDLLTRELFDAHDQRQLRNIIKTCQSDQQAPNHIKHMVYRAWNRVQKCTLSPKVLKYILMTHPGECAQYRDTNDNTILHVIADHPHMIPALPLATYLIQHEMLTMKHL